MVSGRAGAGPRGETETCWGHVQLLEAGSASGMMDVGAPAFILKYHPEKGYFMASETFLDKTTLRPPAPQARGSCTLEGSTRGEETA